MRKRRLEKAARRLLAAGLSAGLIMSMLAGCGAGAKKPAESSPAASVAPGVTETAAETSTTETSVDPGKETTSGSQNTAEPNKDSEKRQAALDAVAEARKEQQEAAERREQERKNYAMKSGTRAYATTAFPEYEVVDEAAWDVDAGALSLAAMPAEPYYAAAAPAGMAAAPAYGGMAQGTYPGTQDPGEWTAPDWNTEEYRYFAENPWRSVKTSPFSTFAADVDTASYANLRRMLLRGQTVPADAVRIEEMINYFTYDYPEPEGKAPFSITTELAPCPWNKDTELLLVGLQAKKLDSRELPPSNLVFLVDVSGSMDEPDKLPLVQRAFLQLTETLSDEDCISLVTYASSDTVVLEGVPGSQRAKIAAAVEDLMAGGGTNGGDGILTAYELAAKHYIPGGNNRVILATDGDLNIGITDEGSLTRLIKKEAESGVFLSVLGFGTGNLSDARMEALADNGNGNYSYIDSISEARKVLTEERGGTLFTVAKDVKLQVEFNPEMVKGYRLIGYENRVMAAEEFADDKKDGGELGAGHRVTALYELVPVDSAMELPEVVSRYGANSAESGEKAAADAGSRTETAEGITATGAGSESGAATDLTATGAGSANGSKDTELLAVNLRWKEPEASESQLITVPVTQQQFRETMSDNLSFAAGVAQAGMLLKESEWAGDSTYQGILDRLNAIPEIRKDSMKSEFLYLLERLERGN